MCGLPADWKPLLRYRHDPAYSLFMCYPTIPFMGCERDSIIVRYVCSYVQSHNSLCGTLARLGTCAFAHHPAYDPNGAHNNANQGANPCNKAPANWKQNASGLYDGLVMSKDAGSWRGAARSMPLARRMHQLDRNIVALMIMGHHQ